MSLKKLERISKTLHDLPVDCFSEICKYLGGKDYLNVMGVSKSIYSIMKNRNFPASNYTVFAVSSDATPPESAKYGFVKIVTLPDDITNEGANNMLCRLPELRFIDMSYCQQVVDSLCLPSLSNLTSLAMYETNLDGKCLEFLPCLKNLTVCFHSLVDLGVDNLRKLKNIKNLVVGRRSISDNEERRTRKFLERGEELPPDVFDQICKVVSDFGSSTKLSCIVVCGYDLVGGNQTLEPAKLEGIVLHSCSHFCLKDLFLKGQQNLKNLVIFDITISTRYRKKQFHATSKTFKDLQSLRRIRMENLYVTDAEIISREILPKLRILEINECNYELHKKAIEILSCLDTISICSCLPHKPMDASKYILERKNYDKTLLCDSACINCLCCFKCKKEMEYGNYFCCVGCDRVLCSGKDGCIRRCVKCAVRYCKDCKSYDDSFHCDICKKFTCGKCTGSLLSACENCSRRYCCDSVCHACFERGCLHCLLPCQSEVTTRLGIRLYSCQDCDDRINNRTKKKEEED